MILKINTKKGNDNEIVNHEYRSFQKVYKLIKDGYPEDNYNGLNIIFDDGMANHAILIKMGILQIILKNLVYFVFKNNQIILEMHIDRTWKEVWDKIKDIDTLEYKLED